MVEDMIRRQLRVPEGIPTSRYRPPAPVDIPKSIDPTALPFISPDDPAHKQLQQVWTAKTRIFYLDKKEDADAYTAVWQMICDGLAQMSENRTDFDSKRGYTAFLRWAEISYTMPDGNRPA